VSNRIYRIYYNITNNEGTSNICGYTAHVYYYPAAGVSRGRKRVKDVKLQSKDLFEAGNKKIYEEGGIAVNSSFFDVFPLDFSYGTPAQGRWTILLLLLFRRQWQKSILAKKIR
jgi:putative ABC transport system permease protein